MSVDVVSAADEAAEPLLVCVASLAVSETDVTLEGVRECEEVRTEAGLREDSPDSSEMKEESEQEEGVRVSEMEGREGRCCTFCEDEEDEEEEEEEEEVVSGGEEEEEGSGPESLDKPVVVLLLLLAVTAGAGFWLTMGILLGDVRGDVCPVLRNKVCAGTVAILPGAELYLNRGRRLVGVAWLPIFTLFFCLSSDR